MAEEAAQTKKTNLKYGRASNDLALLKKDDKMSMNDHIN